MDNELVGPVGSSEVTPFTTGPTALYTITSRPTNAFATMTGAYVSHEAAIAAAITTALAATGATGSEVHVPSSVLLSMTGAGPTGVYSTTYNSTAPLTGATFIGVSREDAINQAVTAGPTGLGAGIAIYQTTP